MLKFKFLFILPVAFLSVFLILPKANAQNNVDTYLQGRAIEVANFTDDEIVPEPIFHYILPGERSENFMNSQSVRIVKIFDPQLSIAGLVVEFDAPKYQITDGAKTYEISSFKGRVEDILADNSIELAREDIVLPARDARAPLAGNSIKITRVSIAQIDELQSIPYQTKKINDPNLDEGKTSIQTAGQNGQQKLSYLVRRENGVEVSRVLIGTTVTIQPVDEVLKIGTKPVITGWCKYNSDVIAASAQNNLDPNKLCALMKKESNGNADSSGQGGAHQGLFQYDPGFWVDVSNQAGYSGADIFDAKSQIYVTAWALTHGYAGRW